MSDFVIPFQTLVDVVYSDTLDYIKTKLNIKKKSPKSVSFFQVLSCLRLRDVAFLLLQNEKYRQAGEIICYELVTQHDCGNTESNFDCFLPFDQRRDYKIKQMLKEVDEGKDLIRWVILE